MAGAILLKNKISYSKHPVSDLKEQDQAPRWSEVWSQNSRSMHQGDLKSELKIKYKSDLKSSESRMMINVR